ncbi:hypothetical protein B7494_g2501 [Chlorociboria aeruginascens]|nr:hypothetical protein B7494_g2501 [Chlorociboria aeruginascens]
MSSSVKSVNVLTLAIGVPCLAFNPISMLLLYPTALLSNVAPRPRPLDNLVGTHLALNATRYYSRLLAPRSLVLPMAPPPLVPTVPNTPLLEGYNENGHTNEGSRLPKGRCNYSNLSMGGNPRCGCQRFWDQFLRSQTIQEGRTAETTGLCMCEHHACFHDHELANSNILIGNGYANARIEYASPTSLSPKVTPGQGPTNHEDAEMEANAERSIPDTLQWNRYINSGASLGSLPAIPSQCLLPSENGSGASSSQVRDSRPFGGLGLDTLSHIPKKNHRGHIASDAGTARQAKNGRPMKPYKDASGNDCLQSLTEVATPSHRASQDLASETAFRENALDVQNALQKLAGDRAEAPQSIMALRQITDDAIEIQGPEAGEGCTYSRGIFGASDNDNLLPKIRNIINHVSDYPMTMKNHEHRLDMLENASFSNAGVDDLQENIDHLDTRVVDLETRMDEVEKAQQAAVNDISSIGSRQQLTSSFDSAASNTSSALVAAAIDRVDHTSRFEALEAAVKSLEAIAPPSHSRPWEVEVVFLPFGTQLKGIWASDHALTPRSRINSSSTLDAAQTQNTSMAAAQAHLTTQDESIAWTSMVPGDQATWLAAKACALKSRVDERLRSRGLVKTIQIRGPDARDVQAAMLSAFGELPEVLAEDPYTDHDQPTLSKAPQTLRPYHGLRASWVPLRKLHKDSCLKFLNSSEMVTQALWTVSFLSSSVAMRATGTRRLYVTQSDSYIQHLGDGLADWTWQKLRQLPRVYPDAKASFDHTPEADAQETCWQYDERLDPAPSLHSSFASHHSSLSIRSISHEEFAQIEPASPSDHFSSAAASEGASTTPTSLPPATRQLSPLKERHPFRPLHTRTISMPTLVPLKNSPSQGGKRRIASFDHETQSSPSRKPSTLNTKRRRISRSPSRPRDSPRWSIGPISPYTFAEDIAEGKRGTTPFAYATPHSNAPYNEKPRSGADHVNDGADDRGSTTDDLNMEEGYEQNALSDYDSEASSRNPSHQPDDEWEGVEDDYESRSVDKSTILRQIHDGIDMEDDESDGNSQPSEYPSTQQPVDMYVSSNATGFRIHVDDE